jgi:hypothetical protein
VSKCRYKCKCVLFSRKQIISFWFLRFWYFLKIETVFHGELCRNVNPNWQADHRGWMRSACSCSFVSSRVVIASLESAPFLSSSLRVGSPRSLYFLRVPQEGFPATELASRRPGHCISTRTCIRGSASSNTGISPHCMVLATVAYSFCSWVSNVQLRHVSSVTEYV